MEGFEQILEELGLVWAPHKQRGPCRVIEFLGLLLVNAPGVCGVGLTEARLTSLLRRLRQWQEKRAVEVDPRELAELLGHLSLRPSACREGGPTCRTC